MINNFSVAKLTYIHVSVKKVIAGGRFGLAAGEKR